MKKIILNIKKLLRFNVHFFMTNFILLALTLTQSACNTIWVYLKNCLHLIDLRHV